jgi:hypothetical protein
MFQVKLDETTTTRRRIPVLLVDATDGYTPETGLSTFTVTVSQNGTILTSQSQTVTEVGNGIYYYTLGTGAVNTLGWVTVNVSATGCRNYNAIVQIMAYDAMDVAGLGLTRLDQTIGSRMATFTLPTNFSALSITGTGAVTAGTVSDKTGYSLTQAFPSNFSSLTISVGGAVTAGTVSDKTGYSLATTPPTATQITDAVWQANIDQDSTATNWPNSSMGQRVLRGESSQASVSVTGSHHVAADIHELQPGVITDADFAAGTVNARLSTMLAADGAVYQYTANALELAPSGGGGGGGSTTVRMGPFVIRAEGEAAYEPLDINLGATHGIDALLVDGVGTGVDLTGATLTTKVYSSSGSLVDTINATATYAAGGALTWTIPTTVTNTAGTYTATITRTTGASDTQVFGALRIYVRDI